MSSTTPIHVSNSAGEETEALSSDKKDNVQAVKTTETEEVVISRRVIEKVEVTVPVVGQLGSDSGSLTFQEVKRIVVEQLNVEEDIVKEDSKFQEDLNADSLDVVELVMAIEEKFGIEIPDSEAEKIKTVKDVVDYIENHK